MSDTRILLDPTAEQDPPTRARQPRPADLSGMTVGILDISKARGNVYLDRLDEILTERGVNVRRYMKPTFARPAPTPLMQTIAGECEVIIEGLAD